ncbi:hypothetical protein [Pseudofrankia inefficax]|uniref:Uncharacterized protein n=1 Tax=Pseudofrankia inefficax (strain DSM 45817 / CECT 9037 / DDB 130130 / EuI1c) TaxID=298654 RepID=E3JAC7_PSEI1|nr:hypothetical protein [Pseudofrankia inefficax]ADP80978.1 hypothetical protein FraEuI1c_2953 [Pseudofrankia inefficax]
MADQDRIAPWFPDIPAAPGPSVRAPRPPAARPGGEPSRPAPPVGPGPGRTSGDDLADRPGSFGYSDPGGLTGPGGRDDPAAGPAHDLPAQLGEWGEPARPEYLPAVPVAPIPLPGPGGGPATGARGDAGPMDPRLAARRYAELLGDADRARGERDALARAGHEDALVQAERYRDAAADVRDRVGDVWRQVAETLAQFGVTELHQVRDHAPTPEALPGIGFDDEPAPDARRRRPALGRDGRRGQASPPRRRGGGAEAADPVALGGAGVAVAERDGAVSLSAELERARQLCLRALASSAELRGVRGASSSLSVGLVTAGGCLLVAVVVAVGRVFFAATGLPCVLGALVVGGALVSVGTEGGGAKAAVRSALLAAGTAGAVVLATLRLAPIEPLGIISSLLALAAAIRFGLGFGAPKPEKPPARGPAGRRR